MSMLYHQAMSLVAAAGEISITALVEALQALPPFYEVDRGDILILINELLDMNHLQIMEQGGLIIGLEGEKIVNNYEFYGVFPTEETWVLMNGSEKIGHIEDPLSVGEYITVAGFSWVVTGVDFKRLILFVKPIPKNLLFVWHGDRALVHNRILQRMKQVLFEKDEYPYLGPKALERLRAGRQTALECGFDRYNVIDLENGRIGILPWMGHRSYATLRSIIHTYMKEERTSKQIGGSRPHFMTFKAAHCGSVEVLERLKAVLSRPIDPNDFLQTGRIRSEKKSYEYKIPKYDRYVPNILLKKQVIGDYINIPLIKEQVEGWRASGGVIL